jgi:hypothetical protein
LRLDREIEVFAGSPDRYVDLLRKEGWRFVGERQVVLVGALQPDRFRFAALV